MKYVAVDANLLLLLVVGSAARHFIAKHKRLRAFSAVDYDLLVNNVGPAEQVVTTPNVLTEVSNLAGFGITGPVRTLVFERLGEMTQSLVETYRESRLVTVEPEFAQLGSADTTWLGLLDDETTLITVDLPLYIAAVQRGFCAVNFNHIRTLD